MARRVTLENCCAALTEAIAALAAGKPVAIPTETVYGLAADATDGAAVARIFALKKRPQFNPLICHVDGLAMAEAIGSFNVVARRLASIFWPGPLTLVVPARSDSDIHPLVTAGLETVGLRCPTGFARQLISAFGRPLAAPSANPSGTVSPTHAAHVRDAFAETDLLVIDGGNALVGLESTILKVEGDRLTLLRPGAITAGMIERATGLAVQLAAPGGGIEAPGMMTSHYAPRAAVECDVREPSGEAAYLGFGSYDGGDHASISRNLSPASNLVEAAANLFAYLKELDALSVSRGVSRIEVAPIPEEGLGIAINDRLRRAAAPRTTAASERAAS